MAVTGLVCVLALLFRAGHAVWQPNLYTGMLQPGPVQGMTFLTAFICILGTGFGFLLANFERVVQQMEHLASIDTLTGCLNRGALETSLERVAVQCRREQASCALVLLDLDHFKQINDHHGHRAGDDVLRGVAAVVRQCLRPTDLFGRMGGEEFCLVLPRTDRQVAHDLAENVRAAVEALTVHSACADGGEPRVTVSAGVVVSDPASTGTSISSTAKLTNCSTAPSDSDATACRSRDAAEPRGRRDQASSCWIPAMRQALSPRSCTRCHASWNGAASRPASSRISPL
jgi:diguanylate cyclase (GGDEF)-like protein